MDVVYQTVPFPASTLSSKGRTVQKTLWVFNCFPFGTKTVFQRLIALPLGTSWEKRKIGKGPFTAVSDSRKRNVNQNCSVAGQGILLDCKY